MTQSDDPVIAVSTPVDLRPLAIREGLRPEDADRLQAMLTERLPTGTFDGDWMTRATEVIGECIDAIRAERFATVRMAAHVRVDGCDLHVLVEPAEDIPGDWTGFVLDADVVSQGQSPGEALDMAIEDWQRVPSDQRNRPAPAEHWGRWRALTGTDATDVLLTFAQESAERQRLEIVRLRRLLASEIARRTPWTAEEIEHELAHHAAQAPDMPIEDWLDQRTAEPKGPPDLPAGWHMVMPGYAVDHGQTKAERKSDHILRRVDARGGTVRTWSHDGRGVPPFVVAACIETAADFPPEFKP